MRSAERTGPAPMARVALVAPVETLPAVLARVGRAGVVEFDPQEGTGEPAAAGVERVAAGMVGAGAVRAATGWTPERELPALRGGLADLGGAVVVLPPPPGVDPPTLLPGSGLRHSLAPLVETYGTIPYADVNPALAAAFAYVVMFGMMFGDAGQGVLLTLAGVALRAGRPRWAARWRGGWPFVVGAGVASTFFGLLYGEFFGPTGVVPVLWLDPLEQPVPLLTAAVGAGALLLTGAYLIGTANRVREGGWRLAVYAPSGIAGSSVFLGMGVAGIGWYLGLTAAVVLGAGLAAAGLAAAFAGFVAGSGGGGTGIAEAVVELMDLIIRLGTNLLSFARLAAFGLTHAAVGSIVWTGTTALTGRGGVWPVAGALVFAAGTAFAFSLEALVAGIQALRLEYYELFSRVFDRQGRRFRPWRLPDAQEEGTCTPT